MDAFKVDISEASVFCWDNRHTNEIPCLSAAEAATSSYSLLGYGIEARGKADGKRPLNQMGGFS